MEMMGSLIEKGERNFKKIFVAILIAQFLFLLVAYFTYGVAYQPDSGSYITPVRNFLEMGRLLDGDGNPILFRTPGYSVFLATVYFLTGYSDVVVVWVQILMVPAITGMIFSLTSRISGKKLCGCLAGFFYALDMAVYTHAVCMLTDALFSFFVGVGSILVLPILE